MRFSIFSLLLLSFTGDFDADNYPTHVDQALLVTYLLVTVIVQLNILIAIVSDSYDAARASGKALYYRAHLSLVSETATIASRCIPRRLLPTIDEAVNMCRPDLRGILGRRLRRHLPAKLSLSALCRMLLEVSHPGEDDARRRQLYCAALTRRDDARSDEVALQRSLAALRYKLAQTDADDVPRAAMLQHEMRQLQRGAA